MGEGGCEGFGRGEQGVGWVWWWLGVVRWAWGVWELQMFLLVCERV